MIYILTNADTEILTLKAAKQILQCRNVVLLPAENDYVGSHDFSDAQFIVLRRLKGDHGFEASLERLRAIATRDSVKFAAIGGEILPDSKMASYSNLEFGLLERIHRYFAAGGVDNMLNLLKYLLTQTGDYTQHFEEPKPIPLFGVKERSLDGAEWRVGVIYYRAHEIAFNTAYVKSIAQALATRNISVVEMFLYSLKDKPSVLQLKEYLESHPVDLIISTTWSSNTPHGPGMEDSDVFKMISSLKVPVLQAILSSKDRASWLENPLGLAPIDSAMNVALCECDGRILGSVIAHKELLDEPDEQAFAGIYSHQADIERTSALCDLAKKFIELRHKSNADKKIAIILTCYPTQKARIGNAVGLDTPKSLTEILKGLKERGYNVSSNTTDSDELFLQIAQGFFYDELDPEQFEAPMVCGSLDADKYLEFFDTLPTPVKEAVENKWGKAPGKYGIVENKFLFAGLDLGNVIVAVLPPRGFGPNVAAIYHDPLLPPTHHYQAFYYFLRREFCADALIHLGKHGTLEWLPGKSLALSPECFPELLIRDLPIFYPFIMNDPGEGIQAKRRIHAVIVDHLNPPLDEAGLYGSLSEIELLLEEIANAIQINPEKVPMLKSLLRDKVVEAKLEKDLAKLIQGGAFYVNVVNEINPGLANIGEDEIEELIPAIDTALCEIKDSQIRSGLHVFGQVPAGKHLDTIVKQVAKSEQSFGPSLHRVLAEKNNLNYPPKTLSSKALIDELSDKVLEELREGNYLSKSSLDEGLATGWIVDELIPRLARTKEEMSNLLDALEGFSIRPGPAGAISRGGVNALPTGRNFYSFDPQAIPSPFSYEVGKNLAEDMLKRYFSKHGHYPRRVAIVLWATANMRTCGDDISEVLALVGVKPNWHQSNRRLDGFTILPIEELKRPRIDVVLRVSGMFRDAFKNLIDYLDEVLRAVSALDESKEFNYLKGDNLDRIFGPKPGSYGSGVLDTIYEGNFKDSQDLGRVFIEYSAYCYSEQKIGERNKEALIERLASSDVALKNRDNQEHDIFDSDDYLQEHGGLIAAIKVSSGNSPEAFVADSSNPAVAKTRTLNEEAMRVFRSRVVNPKWIEAMMQHGYKGAFEMAATVDYVFGYDATSELKEDMFYEGIYEAYVNDDKVREFFEEKNPWAYLGIIKRLNEAIERGMWMNPTKELSNGLVENYLRMERRIEGG